MHNVDVYTSYASCNSEMDNTRHAEPCKGKPATSNGKQESNGSKKQTKKQQHLFKKKKCFCVLHENV